MTSPLKILDGFEKAYFKVTIVYLCMEKNINNIKLEIVRITNELNRVPSSQEFCDLTIIENMKGKMNFTRLGCKYNDLVLEIGLIPSHPLNLNNKSIEYMCKICGKIRRVTFADVNKSKSGNHFCSKSCAATFNNRNKSFGTRRSKFELIYEKYLLNKYPAFTFLFNSNKTIGAELDIYIENLKIAIEIDGIFHHKPIYGIDKFERIKANDKRKDQLCIDNNIQLIRIDISKLSACKELSDILPYIESTNSLLDTYKV